MLLPAGVELVDLPDYSSLRELAQVGRASLGTLARMWRGLEDIDAVWAWGPHPFSIAFATFAMLKRKPAALCIREDTVEYHRRRLTGKHWSPMLGAVWSVVAVYRFLARRLPTVAVGTDVARKYSSRKSTPLPIAISLVRSADIVDAPPAHDWTGEISLLTVGRLEPEKNPLLLVEALARLESEDPGRFRLLWVGRGRMKAEVLRRAGELGVGTRLELRGYIPFGPELLAVYRQSHAFVHVSLTEGLPQVLIEAMAAGIPIVATDVGGVAAALDGGRAGLVVPPADLEVLTDAVLHVTRDEQLRGRLVAEGLRVARTRSLEHEAARVARFIDSLSAGREDSEL